MSLFICTNKKTLKEKKKPRPAVWSGYVCECVCLCCVVLTSFDTFYFKREK